MMGLDGVELLMDIEEAFGVELKDEEVTDTRTPRMVIDLVLSKLETTKQSTCLSQRGFYLLRRTLVEHAGVARQAIKPNVELCDLIETDHAKEVWPSLEQSLEAALWPDLVRPAPLAMSLYVLGGAVFLGVFYTAWPIGVGKALGLGWVALLAFAIAAFYATERFRTRLPREIRRIRDLVPYAATSGRINWTREKVALIVKMLVLEQLGLSEGDYHEDANFYRDLGLD